MSLASLVSPVLEAEADSGRSRGRSSESSEVDGDGADAGAGLEVFDVVFLVTVGAAAGVVGRDGVVGAADWCSMAFVNARMAFVLPGWMTNFQRARESKIWRNSLSPSAI